jgi:hypothetical protein
MRIISIRAVPPGAGDTVARFDAEVSPDIRLFNLKLSGGERGLRVYAPSAYGTSTATFSRELTAALIDAAVIALGDQPSHARASQ